MVNYMAKTLRRISQALFLLLFTLLVFKGKIQVWMGIFLASLTLTLFLGRFYCGWLCPINKVMNLITKIKKKFRIKSLSVPESIKNPIYRYIILAGFIFTFVFVMVSGKKLPVLPGLLTTGILLTLFFPESLWHRYLCPYGTILHIVGKFSKRSYSIIDELCISCGICYRVCPSEAVEKNKGNYMITRWECLLCGKCAGKCPKKAIKYQ